MGNKIETIIPANARELLEAVTENYGIGVIEEYIKVYKKRQKKLMKHYNTKEDVAYDVFKLMFNEGYSRIQAINKVAINRNISPNTINNHLNSFNQKAKEKNFYTLGYIVDRIYNNYKNKYECLFLIDELAKENKLKDKILEAYYWKYKTLIEREKKKFKINLENLKIPKKIKNLVSTFQ